METYEDILFEYNYAIAALTDESTESDFKEIQFLKNLLDKYEKKL